MIAAGWCTIPIRAARSLWRTKFGNIHFMLHLCSTEWLMLFCSATQPAGWKLLRHHLSFLISVKSHLGLVSFSLSHYTPDLAACSPPCRAPALPLNRHFLLELFGSTLSCRSLTFQHRALIQSTIFWCFVVLGRLWFIYYNPPPGGDTFACVWIL